MNFDDPLKLVSQLLDLPIVDKNEHWCGIVDDIELEGEAGKALRVTALLVGPGAYEGRMPAWLFWLVQKIAGHSIARVPTAEIIEVGAVVKLKCKGEELKLHRTENRLRSWIPRWGAL